MALAPRSSTQPSEVTSHMYVHHHQTSLLPVQPQDSETAEVEWNTALLDCFEDASSCCYGFWCCPCLSCTVSGRLQEPYCLPLCDITTCLAALAFHMPVGVPPAAFGLRMAMRNKYKIKGSLMNDLTVSCCCAWCSWCQMHRELKHQNRTPTIINVQNVVSVQPPPMMNQEPGNQTAVTMDTPLLKYKASL